MRYAIRLDPRDSNGSSTTQGKGKDVMNRQITPLDHRVLRVTDEWTDKEFYLAFGFERIQIPETMYYSVNFDKNCQEWDKSPGYNQNFLFNQQAYASTMLKKHGHLFLNEVLDLLKLPRSKFGQTSGWSTDLMCEDVDFGFMNKHEFLSGYTSEVTLTFQVYEDIHLRLP